MKMKMWRRRNGRRKMNEREGGGKNWVPPEKNERGQGAA
jgi:hypothetical protein